MTCTCISHATSTFSIKEVLFWVKAMLLRIRTGCAAWIATDGRSSVGLLLPLQYNIWSAHLLSSQFERYALNYSVLVLNRGRAIGDQF